MVCTLECQHDEKYLFSNITALVKKFQIPIIQILVVGWIAIGKYLEKPSKIKKTAYFMTSGKKVGGPGTKTKFQKKI